MNKELYFRKGAATAPLRQIIESYTEGKCMIGSVSVVLKQDFLMTFEKVLGKAMLDGMAFLNPRMSVPLLALRTFTNRTYVTASVHTLYGVPFRDFISILRVEYAKSFMVENPGLHENVVALKSGFLYASQFVRKFRELTGITPSEWYRRFFNKK